VQQGSAPDEFNDGNTPPPPAPYGPRSNSNPPPKRLLHLSGHSIRTSTVSGTLRFKSANALPTVVGKNSTIDPVPRLPFGDLWRNPSKLDEAKIANHRASLMPEEAQFLKKKYPTSLFLTRN
jgi:hypothetical protein